jgi:pimeloyl-ACP methyl ester carboxylesterase
MLALPDGVARLAAHTFRGDFAVLLAEPDAEPVGHALLVPGWTGSKEDFVAVLPLLARQGWRACSYDQRGQYETAGYPDAAGYDWYALGSDAAAVAGWLTAAAGVPTDEPADRPARVHLVGHSFGGLVAAEAVVSHPDRWASLTLLCSGPAGVRDAGTLAAIDALVDALGRVRGVADMNAVYDAKVAVQTAAGVPPPAAELDPFLRGRFVRNDPAGLAAVSRMLAEAPDRVDDITRTDVPAFVVYGEDDDAWPLSVQDATARRFGSTPVVVADAGHSPAIDQPASTTDVLAGLWRQADPDSGPGTDDDPAA